MTLTIDKAKVRLIIPPDGTQAGEININSLSNEKMSVKVYAEDWEYTKAQDGTKNFFAAGLKPLSCASWVKFSPVEFILSPYGMQTLNYVVRVPGGATGGRYCVIFFETSTGSPLSGENDQPVNIQVGTTMNIRMGSLFYVEAEGTIRRSAEISNFPVTQNSDKHLLISADFKNTGNTDIATAATFDIMDKMGLVYARGKYADTYSMGQDAVVLKATCKERLGKGKYSLIMTVDLGKALEEADIGRGPVMVKEAQIEVGADGELAKVGELK